MSRCPTSSSQGYQTSSMSESPVFRYSGVAGKSEEKNGEEKSYAHRCITR